MTRLLYHTFLLGAGFLALISLCGCQCAGGHCHHHSDYTMAPHYPDYWPSEAYPDSTVPESPESPEFPPAPKSEPEAKSGKAAAMRLFRPFSRTVSRLVDRVTR